MSCFTFGACDGANLCAKSLVANILYPALAEYQFNPALLSLAFGVGSFVGTFLWGLSSDIWGRRCVFPLR